MVTGDLRVEPFAVEHVVETAAIFLQVFTAAPWQEHWTPEEVRARIESLACARDARGWVLTGPSIVGFAIGAVCREERGGPQHLVLEEMAIRSEWQRARLGSALLRVIEEEMRDEGVSRIDVLTAANKWPRRFYEQNGYAFCCRVGESDVLLTRAIDRGAEKIVGSGPGGKDGYDAGLDAGDV